MNRFKLAALLFALALVLALNARAQSVLVSINVTNPAAITFTAVSGNQAQANFTHSASGGSIRFANIFQDATTSGPDVAFFSGSLVVPGTQPFGPPDIDIHLSEASVGSTGVHLSPLGVLGDFNFQTGSTAFSGSGTLSLSNYTYTTPANGATGNILGGPDGVILGTYVVVSSIPEPSTYALVGGACVLGVAVLRRSRAKQPASGPAA